MGAARWHEGDRHRLGARFINSWVLPAQGASTTAYALRNRRGLAPRGVALHESPYEEASVLYVLRELGARGVGVILRVTSGDHRRDLPDLGRCALDGEAATCRRPR